jgi:hypothetical protein
MRNLFTTFLVMCSFLAWSQDTPNVVLNEINADNPGGQDTQEFVEFYGTPGQTLDSLVLVLFDGTTGVSYNAFDLDTYVLDELGFFVVGNANAANVDLVIPNASIQNGADAMVIYIGDATDFPNGTAPSDANMVDAAVYGTGDAAATNLISGLGLDVAILGYTQLDETAQQGGTDLTLSRIPDGGAAFDYTLYVLQTLTPGTYNLPPCGAGGVFFADGSTSVDACDNSSSILVETGIDSNLTYGDGFRYVLTDADRNIIANNETGIFELTGFATGSYFIYAVAYSGVLDEMLIGNGMSILGVSASICVSTSSDFVTINVVPCGGCVGGTIAETSGATEAALCAGGGSFTFTNTSSSQEDTYIYVLSDTTGMVLTTFTETFDASILLPGAYTVTGLSYVGTLDVSTTEIGDSLSGIMASQCVAFSENSFSITVYDCVQPEPCAQLFFSEYLEGNGSTKAIEIFNPTLNTIDLAGYQVMAYNNGVNAPTTTLNLAGSIAPYSTYLIVNAGGGGGGGQVDATVLALADTTSAVMNVNGNDALELRFNGEVIDVIGVVGEDPGSATGWLVGSGSTSNSDLVRKFEVRNGINIWPISATQWDVYALTDFSHLGSHSFNSCSTEVLVGFAVTEQTVNEAGQTLTLAVNAYNVSTPIVVDVAVAGGTADATDYTTSLPASFTFDGTSTSQTFTVVVTNDAIAEQAETILLSLSGAGTWTWLNQSSTITILANDPNCAAGFVGQGGPGGGGNTFTQCSDLPNTAVTFAVNNANATANYDYVVTDANDAILFVAADLPIDMDILGEGTFHIYGLSYTGTLNQNTITEGQLVSGIASDTCADVSNNFITVNRTPCIITGCDAGTVLLSDSTTVISICPDGTSDLMSFGNTSQSVDALYAYFLTDANGGIIQQVTNGYNADVLAVGTYNVYGVSYVGTLDPSTLAAGLPIAGVLASDCAEATANAIVIQVYDCSLEIPCAELFFSEYVEQSQANKVLEIFNPTNTTIDLSTYVVNIYSNGSANPLSVQLAGSIAPYDVFVMACVGQNGNNLDAAISAVADTVVAGATFTGNDAVELTNDATAIDIIGEIGVDPGNGGWAIGAASTANTVLVRRAYVRAGTTDWTVSSGQWLTYDQNDWSHLGGHDYENCVDPGIAGFVVTNVDINEGAGSVTLLVQYPSVTSSVNVELTYTGTATGGTDYATTVLSVTFDPNNTTQIITINLADDSEIESTETIVVTLADVNGLTWANPVCTVNVFDNETVGVTEQTLGEVKVYPVPASDVLNIESSSEVNAYEVIDVVGRKVMSASGLRASKLSVPTEALPAGQYILLVKNNNGTTHKSFVKS